ncbi:hypothetical protein [Mobiluncus mulieris]|uniref:hypothetical protein n=1 Tax=Mobiluncus mulieris TaxID=2052 RepID=UPI0020920696|nr:hypothetical protein [Mobiluncus mulieris]
MEASLHPRRRKLRYLNSLTGIHEAPSNNGDADSLAADSENTGDTTENTADDTSATHETPRPSRRERRHANKPPLNPTATTLGRNRPTPNRRHSYENPFSPVFSSRHAVAITAAVAMAISLGACGYTPKLVSSPTGGKQPPALSETRINALVNEANQVAAAGDAAKDWQQLAPRFLNPALAMRNGEYRVASVANGATVKPLPLAKPQIMTVSQAGSWPRYLFTVSAGAQNEAPQMFAFVQSQARANYGLWGHVRLFPKPNFPQPSNRKLARPRCPPKVRNWL